MENNYIDIEKLLTKDEEIIFNNKSYFFTNLGIYHFLADSIDFIPTKEVIGFKLLIEKQFLKSNLDLKAIVIELDKFENIKFDVASQEEAITIQQIIKELYLLN